MDARIAGTFQEWFDGFVRGFQDGNADDRRNYGLKDRHTRLVRANALQIAGELGLDGDDRALAGAIALFHDVGRFPQYRDYRTFRDSESVNHAALGSSVLIEQGVLAALSRAEQDLIVRAVALHNVFTLPDGLEERLLLHTRIVRDADKLDIWRVFIEILALSDEERPSAAGLGLPDSPEVSPQVLASLEQRAMVRLTQLRCLNDFRLLQLAWIYDLNFLPSLRMVRERDIISALSSALPDSDGVRRAVDAVRHFVEARLDGSG